MLGLVFGLMAFGRTAEELGDQAIWFGALVAILFGTPLALLFHTLQPKINAWIEEGEEFMRQNK